MYDRKMSRKLTVEEIRILILKALLSKKKELSLSDIRLPIDFWEIVRQVNYLLKLNLIEGRENERNFSFLKYNPQNKYDQEWEKVLSKWQIWEREDSSFLEAFRLLSKVEQEWHEEPTHLEKEKDPTRITEIPIEPSSPAPEKKFTAEGVAKYSQYLQKHLDQECDKLDEWLRGIGDKYGRDEHRLTFVEDIEDVEIAGFKWTCTLYKDEIIDDYVCACSSFGRGALDLQDRSHEYTYGTLDKPISESSLKKRFGFEIGTWHDPPLWSHIGQNHRELIQQATKRLNRGILIRNTLDLHYGHVSLWVRERDDEKGFIDAVKSWIIEYNNKWDHFIDYHRRQRYYIRVVEDLKDIEIGGKKFNCSLFEDNSFYLMDSRRSERALVDWEDPANYHILTATSKGEMERHLKYGSRASNIAKSYGYNDNDEAWEELFKDKELMERAMFHRNRGKISDRYGGGIPF